jgi:hypothetical protein
MHTYTIELTDLEKKALEYVAVDANDWIQNAVHERCRIAIEEMVSTDIAEKISKGETISGTKEEIALNSKLPSAKQRHEKMMAEMIKNRPPISNQ